MTLALRHLLTTNSLFPLGKHWERALESQLWVLSSARDKTKRLVIIYGHFLRPIFQQNENNLTLEILEVTQPWWFFNKKHECPCPISPYTLNIISIKSIRQELEVFQLMWRLPLKKLWINECVKLFVCKLMATAPSKPGHNLQLHILKDVKTKAVVYQRSMTYLIHHTPAAYTRSSPFSSTCCLHVSLLSFQGTAATHNLTRGTEAKRLLC